MRSPLSNHLNGLHKGYASVVFDKFDNGSSRKRLNASVMNGKHCILKIIVFLKTRDLDSQLRRTL